MFNHLRHNSHRICWLARLMCTILAVVTLAGIPSAPVKAAPVAKGIDVSKWQGPIDWNAVAKSGVSFAFVRVGNLKKGLDEYFYYNMMAAQAAGIKTGVYIYSYATSVEQAAAEAQFVLNAIQNTNIQVSFPIAWDVEDDCQKGLTPDVLSMMANTFCALIEAEGYYPIVYANKYWFTSKIGPVFYDKWVAQWNNVCEVPGAAVWQYSDKGTIPGINGPVDLDYALKDYSTSIVNTGWVPRKGFLYYYINYRMQRGWLDLGTAKYYLDPASGKMITGWLPLADGTYYLQPDGVMAVGFTTIGPGMYFFGADGKMLTGLQNLNGLTYYFADNGAMYTGFLDLPDGKRFFTTDGHMLTGLQVVANKFYYFDEVTGIMKTGWQTVGGQTYLFAADGQMAYGWFTDGVYKYYLSTTDGHRVSGWNTIDGNTYYFDEQGHMLTGAQNIGGLSFLFTADGAMYKGWFNDGANTRYYDVDGHMAIGLTTINGFVYYFDANGIMQTGAVDVGGVPCLFDTDGKLVTQPPVQ